MSERGDSINTNRLNDYSVGRLLVNLSFPAMVGMVLYSLFSLVDTFFVARLGADALAALTLCIPIELLLCSVGTATGVGVTSLISRILGEHNVQMANRVAWHGIMICMVYGLLFAYFGLQNMDFLLRFFGCTAELYVLCKQYLTVVLFGCLVIFVPLFAGSIVQGEGNTVLPTITSLVGICLNICLDPIFMFGFGPIPEMGLQGAAIARILAQIGATVLIVTIMIKRPLMLTWSVKNIAPRLSVLSDIYKVGFPTLVMEIIFVFIMVLLNKTLVGYNHTAVAALGVFMRIRSLFYLPISGLAQGVMPIAGFAYGARNYDRVKEVMIKASVLSFVVLLAGWFLMQYHSMWVMSFFSNDPALTFVGINCMKLATIFLPFMGPIIILYTVLQAVGQGVSAMWLSLIRTLVFFLPAIIILPHYFSLNGVWLAFSISEGLSILLAFVFFVRLWKDLQDKQRYTVMVMIKQKTFWQRMKIWLQWK